MKVLLIGDYCTDVWIEGDCERLSPEAPVPVFVPTSRKDVSGMAGNVHSNLVSLGPALDVVGVFPKTNAIKMRHIDRKTGHHLLRIDSGNDARPMVGWHEHTIGPFDYSAVVVSDYCKGFLTGAIINTFGLASALASIPWFLDTKRILGPWANGAILKINAAELANNLAAGVRPWEHVSACIITNGAAGMDLYRPTGVIVYHVQGPEVEVRDGAGCGDTVLAALVVAYLENGGDLKAAMSWADKAGRVAVSHRGVVAVKREDVL